MSENQIEIKFAKGMEIAISDTKTSYEIGVELLSICREQNDKHGMCDALEALRHKLFLSASTSV